VTPVRPAPVNNRTGNVRRPRATIVIITQNRKDDLRASLRSATEQEGDYELLVLDDGSHDGTGEMVRGEFPQARVERFDDGAGLAARRNNAIALANGDIIVSIDDDAVFTSPRTVAETVNDFDDPRIAAVAMPFIDVGVAPEVQQRAPDAHDTWLGPVYRGTANAVRRDVLVEVGGYTPEIQWVGEEWDVCLKMMDAGYVIRLGHAEPIHHFTSPKRSSRLIDVYYRRNELLICWMYFPFPWNLVYMVGYVVKGIERGVKVGRTRNMIDGMRLGLRRCLATPRRPVNRAAFRLDRQTRAALRAGRAVRLSDVEARLPPLASSVPPVRPQPHPTVRKVHWGLRDVRSYLTSAVGGPVRCEVCGEVLFRGVAVIWRGRLKIFGAESSAVRADWDKMNRMVFRHLDVDRCRRL
jgi:glycosyltransferase involved in cell wall biosynthesis